MAVSQQEKKSATVFAGSPHASLWIWCFVAAGAVLRLVALGHKSYHLDEIASVSITRLPGMAFWKCLWTTEGNMALYYILLRPWVHLSVGESWVRLMSVVPGIASIPAMYFLARELFGEATGFVAALLISLNACDVVYSQEARAYSLLVLGTIVATYLFVRLMKAPSVLRACAYGVIAGLCLYVHYFAALVVFSHLVAVAFFPSGRRRWKQLLLAAVILIPVSGPALWMMHSQSIAHLEWVTPASWLEFYHLLVFLAAGGGKASGVVVLVLDLFLLWFFVSALKGVLAKDGDWERRWAYGIALSTLLCPILVTLLASIRLPVFYHRFLIICLPGWILCTAVGAMQIKNGSGKSLAIGALGLASIWASIFSYSQQREDWRGAVRYLMAHAGASDRVLYYRAIGEYAAEQYRDWLPGGAERRPAATALNPGANEWQQQVGDAQRIWLVLYPTNRPGPLVPEIQEKLGAQFAPVDERKFKDIVLIEYAHK